MRVNFSVTNQLATPSIHAAALANRPPAGQPGRLFVDTDNPSSGIYRDTGTVWENITGGAGAGNLQTVTDAGNTTTNNILLNYDNSTQDNALVFYNVDAAQEEYLIEKRGIGITTNDSLVIQSRGNISPSTNPVGIMIDGANDVVKSFYTTAYTELGLKLDFANHIYTYGSSTNQLYIENLNGLVNISAQYDTGLFTFPLPGNDVSFLVSGSGNYIKSRYQGNDIGLKLDFANSYFAFGDPNDVNGSTRIEINNDPNLNNSISLAAGGAFTNTQLLIDDFNQLIKTRFGSNDIGLKLDFANNVYELGDINNTYGLNVSNANGIILGDNSGNIFGTSNTLEIITDTIKTKFNGNDIGLKLDFANNYYILGDINTLDKAGIIIDNSGGIGVINGYESNGGNNGISIVPSTGYAAIGDFAGNINSTFLIINDTNQRLEVSGNLASGSAGGSSGQHLKIRVGGVDYKIALLNP